MNADMDLEFSTALRAALVSQVAESVPARGKKHRPLWLGAGVFAGAGLLGGIGAAAAGLLVLPGGEAATKMAEPVTETYRGSATVELGNVPDGATHISWELKCLTAGMFTFEDGASITCSTSDLGGPSSVGGYTVPLAPGQNSFQIETDANVRWQLTTTYVHQTVTEWSVNANGDTYGVMNAKGTPDLIAVVATNGETGYVYNEELNLQPEFRSPEEAITWQESMQGKTLMIPVYDADGKTIVGEFQAGSW